MTAGEGEKEDIRTQFHWTVIINKPLTGGNTPAEFLERQQSRRHVTVLSVSTPVSSVLVE